MYLKSFEYFRAIAIILIVAGHCYDISGWQIDSFFDRIVANIITGGTTLFVFISGFLFHHVFYPRYDYHRFMGKKVENVLFPYLVMSVFAIAQALILHNPFPETYFGPADTFGDQIVRPILLYLLTGGVFAYWYIPFILCIFTLSPLFIVFIRRPRKQQLGITVIFLCISLVLQRPVDNFLVPQSVLFFLPVYLIGILASLEKERLYRHFHDRLGLLLAAILILATIQALLTDACGDLQKPPFSLNGLDLNLLQKLLLCLFFMVFLHRFENRESRLLSTLAASSFAIYFLHGWFIYGLSLVRDRYAPIDGLHLLPLMTVVVIGGSFLLALAVKTAVQGHSRKVIGW